MVGPAFSLKLAGPWTVGGSKNESGPNTTWSVPACAKQRAETCGWLAASAVPGYSAVSVVSAPADASTAASASAPVLAAREVGLLKALMASYFLRTSRAAGDEHARDM